MQSPESLRTCWGRAHGEGVAPEGGARLAQKEEVLPAWERIRSRKWAGGGIEAE